MHDPIVGCLVIPSFSFWLDIGVALYVAGLYMIPIIVVYCFLGVYIQQYNQNLAREATRLQGITQSPMAQAFTEAIYGCKTIRAFGYEKLMLEDYQNLIDENLKNYLVRNAAKQWFAQRIQTLSVMILVPSILLSVVCILIKIFLVKVSAGDFAVLLVYMISITDDIKRLLHNITKAENRFVSFERCYFFMTVPPEKGYKHLKEMKRFYSNLITDNFNSKSLVYQPQKSDWPRTGSIEWRGYGVRYRKDLDKVLKNINIKIENCTKVGILGRTGAGKTTLMSSIFKYFSEYEGEILIDGVSIKDIDLQQLRSEMTIITQDPILFNDSLKKNLDPLGTHSDAEVLQTLAEIGLSDRFKEKGIQFQVESGGTNLSQGEKQLICFGRALLTNHKIMLMDEATANVDRETEKMIQKILEEKFKNCTLLMIAHKLETVMMCDK